MFSHEAEKILGEYHPLGPLFVLLAFGGIKNRLERLNLITLNLFEFWFTPFLAWLFWLLRQKLPQKWILGVKTFILIFIPRLIKNTRRVSPPPPHPPPILGYFFIRSRTWYKYLMIHMFVIMELSTKKCCD